jgi:2-C-methyl-D-erythritol 4-phosphate cytidylyltransferase
MRKGDLRYCYRGVSTMSATVAVVLCAGAGSRTNHSINKVYLDIGGMTMAARSSRPFHRHSGIDELLVVAASKETDICTEVFAAAGLPVPAVIVGGPTRHSSERNALNHLSGRIEAGDIEIILIHDGARPLFDAIDLDVLIALARRTGGAMYGLPIEEDLLFMSNGRVEGIRPRGGLWRALTPQAFRADLLLDAFRSAAVDRFEGTDTASTFERYGGQVEMLKGSSKNLKVTFPEDFVLAECLVELEGEEPSKR